LVNQQQAYNKPLSAQRKDRGNRSKMEYGDSDNYANGGFGNFGTDTTRIQLEKQKKRNDFVNSLEEQIRLKNERQRREKEQEEQYNFPPAKPHSSQTRRNANYQQIEDFEESPAHSHHQPVNRGRGSNMPGVDTR
jgi:hypothetical protein